MNVAASVAAAVGLLIASYVGGYFALCSEAVPASIGDEYGEARTYPSSWLAAAFRPLAQLEEAMTGQRIATQGRDEVGE